MSVKFAFEVEPEFVKAVDGKWLPVEGVRFDFAPDGSVNITVTESLHNARVLAQFLEPNNGKAVVYQGTLPV